MAAIRDALEIHRARRHDEPCARVLIDFNTIVIFSSWGAPPPRPPVIVGLRPPSWHYIGCIIKLRRPEADYYVSLGGRAPSYMFFPNCFLLALNQVGISWERRQKLEQCLTYLLCNTGASAETKARQCLTEPRHKVIRCPLMEGSEVIKSCLVQSLS